MDRKRSIALVVLLLVVAFLLGFFPQYLRARRIEQQLQESGQQLAQCRLQNELSQVRDLSSMMYFETTRKNYGVAGGYASQFFDRTQSVANTVQDAKLGNALREVLNSRDPVTAGLAQGDPGVLSELQAVLGKIFEATKASPAGK
jgi:hypothetical protein